MSASADTSMQLREAIRRDDREACRVLLWSGVDANHIEIPIDEDPEDMMYDPALLLAAREGRAECCQLLINAGADVNEQGGNGWCALYVAACHGHVQCCRCCLHLERGTTLKMMMVGARCTRLRALAMQNAAQFLSMRVRTQMRWATGTASCPSTGPLSRATLAHARHYCDVVLHLICRAPVAYSCSLFILLQWGATYVECCRLLLEAGADVNKPSKFNQFTALSMATHESHVDVCRVLLDFGAETHAVGNFGTTAFLGAPEDPLFIHNLMDVGADIRRVNGGGHQFHPL